MKIGVWVLVFFITAHSLTFSGPDTCPDRIEMDGVVYMDGFSLPSRFLFEKSGAVPRGLMFKAVIKDSLIYIVEAGICFDVDDFYQIPPDMEPIKVPLKVIFPEADSDTIWASSVMGEALLRRAGSVTGDSLPMTPRGLSSLLVQNGRVYRFYPSGTDCDEDYFEFHRFYDERVDSETVDIKNPRYLELKQRLKPYYGEKLWKLVK